jgi:hypothetical protein
MASAHHSFVCSKEMILHYTPIHSGNFYDAGVRRLLAKLQEMDVTVPPAALRAPDTDLGMMGSAPSFSRIMLTMLDWFDSYDYG